MTKEAMISPVEPRQYQSGWDEANNPIYVEGYRVAQVVPEGQTFPMAEPIYWMLCADDVEQDTYYFDTTANAILPVPVCPPNPSVVEGQPNASGGIETL